MTKPPITVFILLFGWICHWQRLVICCPQCTNTSLDCHWSNSVTWLNPKLLIGQQGFVGSFLYNWSKSNFIKNNNIEFNCLYFSYLVDRKWWQPSVLFLSCFLWNNLFKCSFRGEGVLPLNAMLYVRTYILWQLCIHNTYLTIQKYNSVWKLLCQKGNVLLQMLIWIIMLQRSVWEIIMAQEFIKRGNCL